jgi:3-ketosteroid 9alpha-monooxygenase subunit A
VNARIPHPNPNGWFRIAFESELVPGQVKPLQVCGEEIVLFVGESGTPHVLDAHCPHLGAHLGHGGSVIEESLRCPFHAWRFDGDGRCVEVPYSKRIPATGRTRSWPVCVRNGIVWVWHHALGEAPSWDVPELPEYHDADWTPFVHRHWRIRTHCQEIAENTSDPAHFQSVHGFIDQPAPESGPGLAFIQEAVRQMDQDIPIWENKCYRDHPVLCDKDGPIGPFRSWAKQFYGGDGA